MAKTPVYGIKDFEAKENTSSFYINHLNKHVKEHNFTRLPHKHDFYLTMLVTKGTGWHEIDFKKYKVGPGSVFFMQPGQMHYWNLSKDIDGYVFFHSKAFFEEGFTHTQLNEFPFYRSFKSAPLTQVNKPTLTKLVALMKEAMLENMVDKRYKIQRLRSFIHLIFTEIARVYPVTTQVKNRRYLEQLQMFEVLIEMHYKEHKLPTFYANKLHITKKHLNRIVRESVNKTSTEVIAERVVLEAKRLLMNTELNVTETGDTLGFADTSYFVRFFKKHVGITPLSFLKRYEG